MLFHIREMRVKGMLQKKIIFIPEYVDIKGKKAPRPSFVLEEEWKWLYLVEERARRHGTLLGHRRPLPCQPRLAWVCQEMTHAHECEDTASGKTTGGPETWQTHSISASNLPATDTHHVTARTKFQTYPYFYKFTTEPQLITFCISA